MEHHVVASPIYKRTFCIYIYVFFFLVKKKSWFDGNKEDAQNSNGRGGGFWSSFSIGTQKRSEQRALGNVVAGVECVGKNRTNKPSSGNSVSEGYINGGQKARLGVELLDHLTFAWINVVLSSALIIKNWLCYLVSDWKGSLCTQLGNERL